MGEEETVWWMGKKTKERGESERDLSEVWLRMKKLTDAWR